MKKIIVIAKLYKFLIKSLYFTLYMTLSTYSNLSLVIILSTYYWLYRISINFYLLNKSKLLPSYFLQSKISKRRNLYTYFRKAKLIKKIS